MSKRDEIEERRAQRRKENEKAAEAQFELDLEELDKLEGEHGVDAIGAVKVARFVEGLTTRVFFKTPTTAQYQRYQDQYGRATDKKSSTGQRDAIELLAKSTWAYPQDDERRTKLVEEFPGLLVSVGLAAAKKAEAEKEEEGKG